MWQYILKFSIFAFGKGVCILEHRAGTLECCPVDRASIGPGGVEHTDERRRQAII